MAVDLLPLLVLCVALLLCVLLLVKLRPGPGPARFDSGGSPLVPPPHLPSLPVLGSLLSLRGDRPPHLLFQALQERYGALYSLRLGAHRLLLVNHHLHAREVLLKKGKLFAGRPRSVRVTGSPHTLFLLFSLFKKKSLFSFSPIPTSYTYCKNLVFFILYSFISICICIFSFF